MDDAIPDAARAAIRAELDADSIDYRDAVAGGEWTKAHGGPSRLLNLRVPAETHEALRAMADANGTSVSTLVRGFILDGLASHRSEDLRVAIERLERDLAAVKARALAG